MVYDDIFIDDAIVDHLNDIVIANHHEGHSAISAIDAPMQVLQSDNSQSELSSPTGGDFQCLTPETRDSVCALDPSAERFLDFDVVATSSDDGSDSAPRAMARVDGCVSLLPFGIHRHNREITGQAVSFCDDVVRFQF